jgi:ParB/RepB/Spo0J family partition protein
MNLPAATMPVRDVPLDRVDAPPLPTRSEMDDAKMDELVASIRARGVLQNLILVERGDRFAVVAGHRRSIAARLAGLITVPARVYPPGHPELLAIQIDENAKREEVNPVDEAFLFAEVLATLCGNDVDALAGRTGQTLNYVLGRLELLELDDETRDALRQSQISIGVAKALRKVSDQRYRHYYLVNAVRGGATTATVEGWVLDWKRNIQEPSAHAPAPEPSPASATPSTAYDPMRCYVCGKSDHRIPEQLMVHSSCREAILDELLRGAANRDS